MPRAPMERTYLWKGGACSMVKRIEALTPALSRGEGGMQMRVGGGEFCGKHKSRNP